MWIPYLFHMCQMIAFKYVIMLSSNVRIVNNTKTKQYMNELIRNKQHIFIVLIEAHFLFDKIKMS